jgi:hypothetical protein
METRDICTTLDTIYINADSLLNKRAELKARIASE